MKSGSLDDLGDIDTIMRKLRKVRDRIQYADYGYAGLFDTTKVGSAEARRAVCIRSGA